MSETHNPDRSQAVSDERSGSPMKFCAVLSIHPADTPGGAELQSQLICSELSDRGHDTSYIAFDAPERSRERIDGVDVRRLRTGKRYRPETIRRTVSAVEAVDPDVLYFRIIKDLPLAAVAKRRTDAHVVFNVSHDAHCLPRFAHWPGKQDGTAAHTAYRRLKLAFLRSLLTVPDTVFVQTETQQRLLAENRNIDTVLTGNGHPIPEAEPEKHSPPVVLWLASIKRWKQPHEFVDLADSCRDLDCEFWMVGQPTDGELASEIAERAESLPNLEYLGGCSVAESDEYIERASVFVNTSIQEGFPNTFIQSWLRKTPVVSLHADPMGIPDSGETGYYDLEGQTALVAAVRELIERPAHRENVAERAYSHARENYDIAEVVDRIERALPADVHD